MASLVDHASANCKQQGKKRGGKTQWLVGEGRFHPKISLGFGEEVRGDIPLLSPSLNVIPWQNPFMSSFQSPLPSELVLFLKCAREEWTIYTQRASAGLPSSKSTNQFSCSCLPRWGNNFPSMKRCLLKALQPSGAPLRIMSGFTCVLGQDGRSGAEVLKLLIWRYSYVPNLKFFI